MTSRVYMTSLLIAATLTMAVHGEVSEVCKKAMDVGKCKDDNTTVESTRFYFNHTSGGCERFQYSGCQGNDNNFRSFLACGRACACFLSSDKGHCNQTVTYFFRNSESGQCEEFEYTGCGGNQNRFGSKNLCEKLCTKAANKDTTGR